MCHVMLIQTESLTFRWILSCSSQAVCCNDREHCCPKGYKCNVAEQTCDKPGSLSLPWVHKIPALHRVPTQTDTIVSRPAKNMCDAHTSCPKDTTCCFMNKAHKWGCCPLPKVSMLVANQDFTDSHCGRSVWLGITDNVWTAPPQALCCQDGDHCCPSGHTCDPHRSSCSKGHLVIPWYTKQSALTEPGTVADVKCDDKTSCAAGATCCKLETGEWGCCPLVKVRHITGFMFLQAVRSCICVTNFDKVLLVLKMHLKTI